MDRKKAKAGLQQRCQTELSDLAVEQGAQHAVFGLHDLHLVESIHLKLQGVMPMDRILSYL